MKRLTDMTLRELEDGGQRWLEARGLRAGEDCSLLNDDEDDVAEFIEEDGLYDELRERWLDEQ